jgi:hypothetical protein
MTVTQTRFRLLAVFWIAMIGVQYYFLYKKFHHLSVCHEQHNRVDTMQRELDTLKR